jgi:hypothetical protein
MSNIKYLIPIVIVFFFLTASCFDIKDEFGIIKSSWKVVKIEIKNEDVTNKFKRLTFTLLDDQKLINPKSLDYKAPYPSQYNMWSYRKKGNYEGVLIIEDKLEGRFSGNYEIELLQGGNVKKVLLYNDSIKFHLIHTVLTLENPTVPRDFDINN